MYSKWRKSGCRRNNGKRGERIIAMKTVTKLFNGEEDHLVVQWLRLQSQCKGPGFSPWSGS